MKVPLLDMQAQYRSIAEELREAVTEVLESQQFILGPKVAACEETIARYSQCEFGVGVSSGTDALLLCLMAEEIGPGDEVITTPYTFFATAGSIARTGATPVFVDIDPVNYNIDPVGLEEKITDKTRAIIPVHLYGQMADMPAILEIAQRHGLTVIEDAAQAIGAELNGKRAGSFGDYGCFSFFPSKNLGAAGDGGMVVTNDKGKAERLRCLRSHGSKPKYYHQWIGGNFRLDALQAGVINAKFRHLDGWTHGRQSNARRYQELFLESGLKVGDSSAYGQEDFDLILPHVNGGRHVFNQYTVRTTNRDRLREYLAQREVGTEIYYPLPMHLQSCFSELGYRAGAFPESEAAAKETLSLPIYSELEDAQAEYVVDCIRDYFGQC